MKVCAGEIIELFAPVEVQSTALTPDSTWVLRAKVIFGSEGDRLTTFGDFLRGIEQYALLVIHEIL